MRVGCARSIRDRCTTARIDQRSCRDPENIRTALHALTFHDSRIETGMSGVNSRAARKKFRRWFVHHSARFAACAPLGCWSSLCVTLSLRNVWRCGAGVPRRPVFMRVCAGTCSARRKFIWTSRHPSDGSRDGLLRGSVATGSPAGQSQGLHLPQKID